MHELGRRGFLQHGGLAMASVVAAPSLTWAAEPKPGASMSLGFSLYGMKRLKTEEALRVVAEIGYDSAELCLMPGWDAEPTRLGVDRRKEIRSALGDAGLKLTALMELVSLSGRLV